MEHKHEAHRILAPFTFKSSLKKSWMYLPNREELLFLVVAALPNLASNGAMQVAWRRARRALTAMIKESARGYAHALT